jgi:UDP-N-acetylmuramate: L-alanyl-gamma-D-glutamyl-meso-diaminopimelate ligase
MNGHLIAGWDSQIVRELNHFAHCSVQTFGTAEDANWRAVDIDFAGELTTFRVTANGTHFGQYRTPAVGIFNVRNCLGVIAACEQLGFDRQLVSEAIAEFRSVKRRMQVRGVARGVTVIDDFAHHPTAVRETLQAARQKYSGRRIVAVFEPRSYTAQRKEFQNDFTKGLMEADKIIISGLFHPERYDKDSAISPLEMIDQMRSHNREADFIQSPDEIVVSLVKALQEGDVVVVMSNGSFGGIHEKLLNALNRTTTK